MVFGILLTSECVLESTRVKTWFENRSSTDMLVWTPFGRKTEFVSGNCVREACEFIPWTMKTFDHRG
jgi:hypothetical protein